MNRPIRKSLNAKNMTIMGIPKKYHDLTVDDFQTYGDRDLKKVKHYVKGYVDNIGEKFDNNSGLYLYGANGVGKTMLSCLIVKEAYRHRYTAKRVTFAEYVKKYTDMWGAKTPTEKDILEDEFYNRYKAVDFLVLEEVGKELDTKAVRPILEDLLRYREDNGLVTIYCTNLAPSQLKEIYGSSIYSLVTGNTYPIPIDSTDRRRENFKK